MNANKEDQFLIPRCIDRQTHPKCTHTMSYTHAHTHPRMISLMRYQLSTTSVKKDGHGTMVTHTTVDLKVELLVSLHLGHDSHITLEQVV